MDFFCNEIMGRFDIEEKNFLDFKVCNSFVELIWGVDTALSGGDWYYDEIGVDG